MNATHVGSETSVTRSPIDGTVAMHTVTIQRVITTVINPNQTGFTSMVDRHGVQVAWMQHPYIPSDYTRYTHADLIALLARAAADSRS